ncbi:hypothetical protein PPL_01533 [Heterostelium album PN500]|uniref:Uncharacterized protein n=1 Tax=Heterostelium pallidum (strain ATCC 26659 / Pp 5 / PN500) TaxID=670386 RepID=D3AZS0_HETP5|nr:hypothetical protein PPL_01533 [Heterostelium album PN500]EFA84544.1 hypothetical protein PPL_01533 [Heterostelium album PN500]|eukprot:XP_020436657.1 hypothetical protein PPL_01533 [Heterostelium album PN500]
MLSMVSNCPDKLYLPLKHILYSMNNNKTISPEEKEKQRKGFQIICVVILAIYFRSFIYSLIESTFSNTMLYLKLGTLLAVFAYLTNPSIKSLHDLVHKHADKKGAFHGFFSRVLTKIGPALGSYTVKNFYVFTLIVQDKLIIGNPKVLAIGAFGNWWSPSKIQQEMIDAQKKGKKVANQSTPKESFLNK